MQCQPPWVGNKYFPIERESVVINNPSQERNLEHLVMCPQWNIFCTAVAPVLRCHWSRTLPEFPRPWSAPACKVGRMPLLPEAMFHLVLSHTEWDPTSKMELYYFTLNHGCVPQRVPLVPTSCFRNSSSISNWNPETESKSNSLGGPLLHLRSYCGWYWPTREPLPT